VSVPEQTARQARQQRVLLRQTAVLGVGNTDYAADWQRARAGERCTDSYGYAAAALRQALADAGLTKDSIDGLVVSPNLAYELTAETLGLNVRFGSQADAAGAVLQAALAITTGMADCVALVYGNDQRTSGVQYGGPQAMGGERFLSYVYYSPWGLTSQGALYALMAQRYMAITGLTSAQLGEVAVAQRMFASMNEQAVMRKPLTVPEYLDSRFIVEPLRLFDYTIINDGGVALIMASVDFATAHGLDRAVIVAGAARSDLNVDATSLRPRLIDFYHTAHAEAADAIYDLVGYGPNDVDLVQIYDSFTCHVPFALAGFGFSTDDDVGGLLASGALRPGGRLPVNTSGGHLSESYMQGWNHQVESVRQLRHEAGSRQVPDASRAQYIADSAGKVVTLMYERGIR
jgi:acetyl-CoA acetyltransferase